MNINNYEEVGLLENGNKLLRNIITGNCVGVTQDSDVVDLGDNYDYAVVGDYIYLTYCDGMDLLDLEFNKVFNKRYTELVYSFLEDKGIFIAANEEYKYGVLDSKGNILLPFKYREIRGSSDGVIVRDDSVTEIIKLI